MLSAISDVSREAEEKPELAKHDFYFRTVDISAISGFLNAMKTLTTDLRLHVSPTGIQVGENLSTNQLFIFANFDADSFEVFESKGTSVICFNCMDIHRCFSNHQQTDVMYWSFSAKKPKQMKIGVLRNGSEDIVSEFTVGLLACTSEVYSAKEQAVDYFLAISPSLFTDIINVLYEIRKDSTDNWVSIECTPSEVIISKTSGHLIPLASFTLIMQRRNKSVQERRRRKRNTEEEKLVPDGVELAEQKRTVKHSYHLHYLHKLLKCFSLNREYMLLYVTEGRPLIFETKIGTLGVFKAVVMFRVQENEEDYFHPAPTNF